MSHKTNLAVQALSNLSLVSKIETLFQALHSYFTSSPKRYLEFTKFIKIVETMLLLFIPLPIYCAHLVASLGMYLDFHNKILAYSPQDFYNSLFFYSMLRKIFEAI